MRKDIQALIQANNICVLATVSEGDPHCSLMSYATDDDCREIYMATHKETKKYRNLTANPSVSLLVDSRQDAGVDPVAQTKALTISGTLQRNLDEKKIAAARRRLFEKHAGLKKIFNDPDTEIIIVKIRTVQLLDGITDAYYEDVS
ncbi:MAG: pyridoxamine 5'-phosphate oxidase family protein [Deltaproteobacteria bacterium HGW-Deltaproteobacteria-6]|jgi:nitroimidazol reductase NimA-like FMN-containing flavoprotein (pyridoxamine 5'-phosphate oxidase superfamily)|nr:MAG: pyridoxamine 5'-phosphate oxidase family protein [Deltaproteobacteria bacterium HGW-Deltaproteobacteria-6]